MNSFVAIDFETANQFRTSACAVSAVRFNEEGIPEETFTTLLKPHPSVGTFHWRNIRIHGIRPDDVASAPEWDCVAPVLRDFVAGLPLVAHNMSFDGGILDALADLYRIQRLPATRLCTLCLSRKLLSHELRSRSLNHVFHYYFPGEDFAHHEAQADATAAGRIFARMQDDFGFAELEKMCLKKAH